MDNDTCFFFHSDSADLKAVLTLRWAFIIEGLISHVVVCMSSLNRASLHDKGVH